MSTSANQFPGRSGKELAHSKKNNQISKAFYLAQEENRGAVIAYLMAGDPSPKDSRILCEALIDGGVDILELGVPFSDPIADGPVIQSANLRSLSAGTTPRACFEIARHVKDTCRTRRKMDVPIVLLSYFNTIHRFGVEQFLAEARSNGVDGLIVPDLPDIESSEFESYRSLAAVKGMSPILLAAPTTTKARLGKIISQAEGFLYVVSVLGVTGPRNGTGRKQRFDTTFISRAGKLAHESSGLPVAVGFGISQPAHVHTVLDAGADGVIVGSALVDIVSKKSSNIKQTAKELERFATELERATHLRKERKS